MSYINYLSTSKEYWKAFAHEGFPINLKWIDCSLGVDESIITNGWIDWQDWSETDFIEYPKNGHLVLCLMANREGKFFNFIQILNT